MACIRPASHTRIPPSCGYLWGPPSASEARRRVSRLLPDPRRLVPTESSPRASAAGRVPPRPGAQESLGTPLLAYPIQQLLQSGPTRPALPPVVLACSFLSASEQLTPERDRLPAPCSSRGALLHPHSDLGRSRSAAAAPRGPAGKVPATPPVRRPCQRSTG